MDEGANRLNQILVLFWQYFFGADQENDVHCYFLEYQSLLDNLLFLENVADDVVCVLLAVLKVDAAKTDHLFSFVIVLSC